MGKRKSKRVASCRVKDRKAQKECKQRGIGKRKSKHVASCRVKDRKAQKESSKEE
jgi:hypothetical protein